MQKFILTALFLLVMASFLLESPSQTRFLEVNSTLQKRDDQNSLLVKEEGHLKMLEVDTSGFRKASTNAFLANASNQIEAEATLQYIEE